MAIHSYQQDGLTLYRVNVHRRSSLNPTIRGQKQQSGFKTYTDAKRFEEKLVDEITRNNIRREDGDEILERLLPEWRTAQYLGESIQRKVQGTTAEDNVRVIELYAPDWLRLPASSIRAQDVWEVLDRMDGEQRSNSRKRQFISAVNGFYSWAIGMRKVRHLIHSPAMGVKISRKESRKPGILTRSEILKLLNVARDLQSEWFPVWAAAAYTGMRSGELLALKFADVDWEGRKILVSKSYNKRLNQVKCTKSGYYRDVPINEELMGLLKDLRATANGREYVLPRISRWQKGDAARELRKFCEGIGITPINFHALRACFATQLLRDKVAPAVVMRICGWAELKTMQRYVRLAGIELEGATDSLRFLSPEKAVANIYPISGELRDKIGKQGRVWLSLG